MTDRSRLVSALENSPELVALRARGLAAMELFEGCEPEDLTALAGRLRPLRAESGQVLMRQGEQAVSFILIQSGAAAVSHSGDDGELVLDEVAAGVIVGEIALLRDKPRTATVTATVTVNIAVTIGVAATDVKTVAITTVAAATVASATAVIATCHPRCCPRCHCHHHVHSVTLPILVKFDVQNITFNV